MQRAGDLASRIAAIEAKSRQRRGGQEKKAAEDAPPKKTAKPKKPKTKALDGATLPAWPESVRGVPNAVLRGALFAAIQGKGRRYMKREVIASQKGIRIRFTGMQLDQSDMDVWEQAIQLAREHPLGTRCEFTAHGFLKVLERSVGKKNHTWLKDAFARLASALVEITVEDRTYFGTLIDEGARDEVTGEYVLEINPKLLALYEAGYTHINWSERQLIRGKPLALWLHGFISSHKTPYPLSVEYLHKLSGGSNPDVPGFRRHLKNALHELEQQGLILEGKIENNLVIIKKK